MRVKQLISKMMKQPETSAERSRAAAPGVTNLEYSESPWCSLHLLLSDEILQYFQAYSTTFYKLSEIQRANQFKTTKVNLFRPAYYETVWKLGPV